MKNFTTDSNLPLYKAGLQKVWDYAQQNPLTPPRGPSPAASTVMDYLFIDKKKATSDNLEELIKKAKVEIPENLKGDFQTYCEQEIDAIWGMMMM